MKSQATASNNKEGRNIICCLLTIYVYSTRSSFRIKVCTYLKYLTKYLVILSGASTLQLAVFSEKHWETDRWSFLLSCCDSSQLADGAAVAIVFHNIPALKTLLKTGRCNTNIPTTLTGRYINR